MQVLTVIPARFQSSRLPGKPLLKIKGKSLIQWVYEKAAQSKLTDRVIVATDDEKIMSEVRSFGGEAMMTALDHLSGTDRVVEVAQKHPSDIIINLQGDEPLIHPAHIDLMIESLKENRFEMVTLRTEFKDSFQIQSPSVVKVICNHKDEAIYFSRFPIPFSRGTFKDIDFKEATNQHIGIYGFTKAILTQWTQWKPVAIEQAESLEQLRALYYGVKMGCLKVTGVFKGIDVPEDIAEVEKLMERVHAEA